MTLDTEKKINLRKLAEKARDNPGWTHVAYIEANGNFHDAATPTAVLALFDEFEPDKPE
jgi:hypothetical protein